MKLNIFVAALAAGVMASHAPAPALAQQQRSVEPPQTGPGCPRPGTRSPASSQRAPMTFFNGQHREAHLYWVDFQGNWVFYARIPRGQEYRINSFTGHVWVALNERGRCVSTFPAPPRGGNFGL